jgi:hypothetical protein
VSKGFVTEVSMDGKDWHTLDDPRFISVFPKEMYRYERRVIRREGDGVVLAEELVREPPPDVPLKAYLRIGSKFGPGVYQNDDRWGQPVDSYTANDWFCVEPERWAAIQEWQSPLNTDTEAMFKKGVPMDEIMRVAGDEINKRFARAGCKSTIWQMDMARRPSNRWDERVRVCAVLGIDSEWGLREWSWYECYVGHPLSVLKAKVMNKEASKRRLQERP